jgi:hypothetical protein
MACPNFKNGPKKGLDPLGVKSYGISKFSAQQGESARISPKLLKSAKICQNLLKVK